jgi:hypothetical protein
MVRKKSNKRRGHELNRQEESAESALVRDASEVRALMDRAQRLLRGESVDAVESFVAVEATSVESIEAAHDDGDEGDALPDGSALVSPKPTRRADQDDGEDELASDDDEAPLEALPEAFLTTTMGTMLLSQGRAADARAVFERVLERNPHDGEAQRGLTKALTALGAKGAPNSAGLVRARMLHPALPTHDVGEQERKEPDGLLERADPPGGYDVDELRVLPVDPTTIVAFWELRASTLKRLADEQAVRGDLLLRVVTLVRGEDGSLRRVERFEGPVSRVGDWFVWGLATGATHEVSLGIAGRVGFTPVLTAEPVRTPRGAPARARSVVRARIVLPERTKVAAAEVPRIAEVVGPATVIEALRESRATVALEGATVTADPLPPVWLEERSEHEPIASPIEHWADAVPGPTGADTPSAPAEEAAFSDEVVLWPIGSSWGVVARSGLPSSPTSSRPASR